MDAKEALKRLAEGNVRFATGHVEQTPPKDLRQVRQALTEGQEPFAIIVGCSDSRVSPEIVFDAQLGELFDIRTAGHVCGDYEIGSVQYCVEHLGTRLILVLGHEGCGAVTAAVEGGEAPGAISSIVEAIQPAVEATAGEPDQVDAAVRQNSRNVAEQLLDDPMLSAVPDLVVLACRYDLDTGLVAMVPEALKGSP
jgi:carbonic anhydrase